MRQANVGVVLLIVATILACGSVVPDCVDVVERDEHGNQTTTKVCESDPVDAGGDGGVADVGGDAASDAALTFHPECYVPSVETVSWGGIVRFKWNPAIAGGTITLNESIKSISALYSGATSTGTMRTIGAELSQISPCTDTGSFTFGFGAEGISSDRIVTEHLTLHNCMSMAAVVVLNNSFGYDLGGERVVSYHFSYTDQNDPMLFFDVDFAFDETGTDTYGRPVSSTSGDFTYSASYSCAVYQ